MITARTLTQLQGKGYSPERAKELGQLGYMQWLGGLPADANYEREAVRAFLMASNFIQTDPAIGAFCRLLMASLETPLTPLPLSLPNPRRRGGARERRLSI